MKRFRYNKSLAINFKFIDGLVGFLITLWISDVFIEPKFNDVSASYGRKLLNWLFVTLIFLAIGIVMMVLVMLARIAFKSKSRKNSK